jgi:hypothetical protein
MPLYSIIYSFPYLFVFILLYCYWLLPVTINNNSSIFISKIFLSGFTIFVFIGFRGAINSDWASYYDFYQKVPSLFDVNAIADFFEQSSYWEKGYLWLNILFKTISGNYFSFQFFLFLINFIILCCTCSFYIGKKYLPGLLVFYFLFNGIGIESNLLRNSKAIMLFIISIRFIEEKRIIPFLLLNGLGYLFHASALIYIPLYFFISRRFSRICIFGTFIAGVIILFFSISWIKDLIESLLPLFGFENRLLYLTELYLNSTHYSSARGISIGTLERLVSFILVFCREKYIIRHSRYMQAFINLFYVYIFSYLYFSEFLVLADRFAVLFCFSYWYVFPLLYVTLAKETKKIFMVCFILYACMKIFVGYGSLATYYNFIWVSESELKNIRSNIFAVSQDRLNRLNRR